MDWAVLKLNHQSDTRLTAAHLRFGASAAAPIEVRRALIEVRRALNGMGRLLIAPPSNHFSLQLFEFEFQIRDRR